MNEEENNFIINADIGEGSLRRRARGYLKLRNCPGLAPHSRTVHSWLLVLTATVFLFYFFFFFFQNRFLWVAKNVIT